MVQTENVPALTAQLLELYREGPLRDIRFPDADEERLTASVDNVIEARAALARAELAVSAARSALLERDGALAQETEKTLAYARIYAAERPELRAALDQIREAVDTKRKARSPGRPRKVRAASGVPEALVTPDAHAAE